MSALALPLGLLLASLFGSALSLWRQGRSDARASSWMDGLYPVAAAFFIGFLVTALMPHLFEAPWTRLPAFGLGVAVMAVWSRRVAHHDPCCEVGHDPKPLGTASAIAMAICSLNDGLLLGLLTPMWLSGVNLGMLLHKVTSSFALGHLLSKSSRTRAALWAWSLAYALVSPATFFLGQHGVLNDGPWLGLSLGFSAGILAYSIWTGMLPHSRRILKQQPTALVGFLFALAISVGLGLWHRTMHH